MVLAVTNTINQLTESSQSEQPNLKIPHMLEEIEHTLPVVSYWLDKPDPLPMLMPNTVQEKELVALPEREKVAITIQQPLEPREELNLE
jgi:hypothetical protein